MAVKKTTVSLPESLMWRLDKIAAVSGVTRSALISHLLEDRVFALYDLVETTQTTPYDVKRARNNPVPDPLARKRLKSLLQYLALEDAEDYELRMQ